MVCLILNLSYALILILFDPLPFNVLLKVFFGWEVMPVTSASPLTFPSWDAWSFSHCHLLTSDFFGLPSTWGPLVTSVSGTYDTLFFRLTAFANTLSCSMVWFFTRIRSQFPSGIPSVIGMLKVSLLTFMAFSVPSVQSKPFEDFLTIEFLYAKQICFPSCFWWPHSDCYAVLQGTSLLAQRVLCGWCHPGSWTLERSSQAYRGYFWSKNPLPRIPFYPKIN